ncbi:MAG TPA: ATP-binding protein [Bacteriovoracaceae bacterium]|nr:ATP-binding protein [Bacteriovoracaceae bacterium]
MIQSLLKTDIRNQNDVVRIRKTARDIAQFLGADVQGQTRIATAVSEIARNAFEYANGGKVEFQVIEENQIKFVIIIKDRGPGIKELNQILEGKYVSPQGMGLGIVGAIKLMDKVEIETDASHGTTVTMKKFLPQRQTVLTSSELKIINEKIMGSNSGELIEEVQRQNQEILVALADLNEKKEELLKANQELEDTNRSVIALYAELDEKAEVLRLANESKTSFLSDMTHEFRSPLNSILGISQILLMEAREDKAAEREKQVNFILKAARGLSDLVNDLLDIAKIEAGKITVKAGVFKVSEIMGSLRGLMRPIGGNENVELHFDVEDDLTLKTDEGKLTQILRNLISNALKYTPEGKIVVTAKQAEDGYMLFIVRDTGIGIPLDLQESIFQEFFQVENSHQEANKGTGLGLPLSRKLSLLLGGELSVQSSPGNGSTFKLKVPLTYDGPDETDYHLPAKKKSGSVHRRGGKLKVLVVDDDESMRYQIKKILDELGVDVRLAEDGLAGMKIVKVYIPDLVILDLVMPNKDGMGFISDCMESPATRQIPILLHTSKPLETEERLYLEQVTSGILAKQGDNMVEFKKTLSRILGIPDAK